MSISRSVPSRADSFRNGSAAACSAVTERIATARHFRVFPGEGVHSSALADLVVRLDRIGYRGDYSFEVFNDDYQQMPLPTVAARARRCAIWLAEDVLRRAVPLPDRIRLRRADA